MGCGRMVMLLGALSLATMLAGCNPADVADTVRRDLPPPARVCTEDVPVPYPRAGQSWRAAALGALEAAERLHGYRAACAEWYGRLRARYAGGGR